MAQSASDLFNLIPQVQGDEAAATQLLQTIIKTYGEADAFYNAVADELDIDPEIVKEETLAMAQQNEQSLTPNNPNAAAAPLGASSVTQDRDRTISGASSDRMPAPVQQTPLPPAAQKQTYVNPSLMQANIDKAKSNGMATAQATRAAAPSSEVKLLQGGLVAPPGNNTNIAMAKGGMPAGALASEMADDIPVKLSEGEYVLPGFVVRYFGLKHIEGMVNEAKSSMNKLQEKGRIRYPGDGKNPGEAEEESEDSEEIEAAAGGMASKKATGLIKRPRGRPSNASKGLTKPPKQDIIIAAPKVKGFMQR